MQSVQSRLTILHTAFLSSSLVYLIVGFALVKTGWKPLLADESLSKILLGMFVLTAIFMMGILLTLKKKDAPADEKAQLSRQIIFLALSEVPAILGLVLFLLTAKFLYLVFLCAISLFLFSLVRPQTSS